MNESGIITGTRAVEDADGVPVELLFGSQVIARTTTIDGVYTFSGLTSGAYQAQSFVNGPRGDKTKVLTIVSTDLFSGDTLQLAWFGDLLPVPNPVGNETVVQFGLQITQFVDINIMSIAGDTVRTLLRETLPTGTHEVRWDGTDKDDVPVSGSMYWLTMAGPPPDYRAQLLFK